MTRMVARAVMLMMVAVGFAVPALAQKSAQPAAEPLQITLARSKVTTEGGKEVLVRADIAKPGDVLEEVATYRNVSKAAVRKVEATLPVPPNTELVLASVKPGNAKASVDGKTFANLPLKRKVRNANGVEVEQPVPLSEYRFLRWYPGDMAPEASLSFTARFKVADSAPLAAAANRK